MKRVYDGKLLNGMGDKEVFERQVRQNKLKLYHLPGQCAYLLVDESRALPSSPRRLLTPHFWWMMRGINIAVAVRAGLEQQWAVAITALVTVFLISTKED